MILIQALLPFSNNFSIQTADDIPNALKDLLGGTIHEMLEAVTKK